MGQWWEHLIKVQTGFTSYLNPFRTFLSISFTTFSQDFGSCHKSGPQKNKKKEPPWLQNTVTFQPQSLGGFWISDHHILCSDKHNEIFVLGCATWQSALTLLLKYLWDGKWSQVWHAESELLLWCQERPSSDQPWSGIRSSLNGPEGADTTWEIHLTGALTWLTVFIFLNPRDWNFSSVINHLPLLSHHNHLSTHSSLPLQRISAQWFHLNPLITLLSRHRLAFIL